MCERLTSTSSTVHRTVELRSYVESAREESETWRWDTEDLWNSDIDVEAALGMGHLCVCVYEVSVCLCCADHVVCCG